MELLMVLTRIFPQNHDFFAHFDAAAGHAIEAELVGVRHGGRTRRGRPHG